MEIFWKDPSYFAMFLPHHGFPLASYLVGQKSDLFALMDKGCFGHEIEDLDVQGEFFPKLANQSLGRIFLRFDLTAGKLPLSTDGPARGAAGN